MEWRYYGVQYPTKQRVVFGQRLLQAIRYRRCGQELPAIRTSPNVGGKSYLFLASVEDEEELPASTPELIREVLQAAGNCGTIFRPNDHDGGFTLEEIRRFTGPNLTTENVGSLRDLFRLPALAEIVQTVLDLSALDEEEIHTSVDPDLASRCGATPKLTPLTTLRLTPSWTLVKEGIWTTSTPIWLSCLTRRRTKRM